MARNLEDLRGAIDTSAQQPFMSIKGGDFRLVDSLDDLKVDVTEYDPEKKIKYVDAVVVDINPINSRIYFTSQFNENAPEGPVCFSDNGIAPSTHSSAPQSATCRGCPHAEWGTSLRPQSRGKACRDIKKIAIMVPAFDRTRLWLLKVPPTSLTSLGSYSRQLAALKIDGRGALSIDVLTRISFSKVKLFSLDFNVLRAIRRNTEEDQALYEQAVALFEDGSSADMVGLNDTPISQGLLLAPPSNGSRPRETAPAQLTHARPYAPPVRMRREEPVYAEQEAGDTNAIIDTPFDESVPADLSNLPRRRK